MNLLQDNLAERLDAALLGTAQARLLSVERARRLDAHMSIDGDVRTYRHPTAPVPLRPVLLPGRMAVGLAMASRHLLRLIQQVCSARAPRLQELAAALGYEAPPCSIFTDNPSWTRWAMAMARPDMVASGGRLRFVECNIDSSAGGSERLAAVDSFFWRDPAFGPLAQSLGLWSVDSFEARRRVVIAAGRSRGRRRPSVCLLGWSREQADEQPFKAAVNDFVRHGTPCIFATPNELEHDARSLRHQDFQIDVVLRTFTVEDAHEGGLDFTALKQAVKRDSTLILAPEASILYCNKKTFAWLTQAAPQLSRGDQRFIAQMVPWTWELDDVPAVWQGADVDLLDLVERRQEQLVLKPAGTYGGQGVVAGRDVSAAQWRLAVEAALRAGNHVVQQFYPPDLTGIPVYLPEENTTEVRAVASVYSPLLMGGSLSGVQVRQMADPGISVINTKNGCFINTTFFSR